MEIPAADQAKFVAGYKEQLQKTIDLVGKLEGALMHSVEVAMTLSELRDPYTAGHERRVAELAVQEAVQMHGGVGMTDAFDVGLYMKRVRVLNELLGDAQFHTERFARSQGF